MVVLYSNYHITTSINVSNRNDKIAYQVMLTHCQRLRKDDCLSNDVRAIIARSK